MRLVDIAGLVKGASHGEGLGNKFLSHIRSVDAILLVVRCFEDQNVAHVDGGIDPVRDIDTVDTELLLADLQTVEAALDKANRAARTGDKDAKARVAVLQKCASGLSAGEPIRGCKLDAPDEAQLLRSFGLLTAKRVLYVLNVADDDVPGQGPLAQAVRKRAEADGVAVVPVSAKLESELAELDEADRQELLDDLGLAEPALAALTRATYEMLGLHTFFTTRSKELRAWTVPVGTTAPEAAGVIHTDFQHGFIRAEVYRVADLEQYESEAAIRSAGKLRTEGKDYVIQDGDVCHFLFNA